MITSAVVLLTTKDGRHLEIPCHRHADAFYIASQLLGANELDNTKTQQGFSIIRASFLIGLKQESTLSYAVKLQNQKVHCIQRTFGKYRGLR